MQLCSSPKWKAAPCLPALQSFCRPPLLLPSQLLHTHAAHVTAAGILFLNCNTCVYTCLLQVEDGHLLHVVEGRHRSSSRCVPQTVHRVRHVVCRHGTPAHRCGWGSLIAGADGSSNHLRNAACSPLGNCGGVVRQAHVLKCFVLVKEEDCYRIQRAVVEKELTRALRTPRRTPSLVRGTRKTACS